MSIRVHLLANIHRKDAVAAASKAAFLLHSHGVVVFAHSESAKILDLPPVSESEFAHCNLAISFGGDGTLIRVAQLCSVKSTPVLGVYYGRFGFVTQCLGEQVDETLSDFLEGNSEFEERMMLETHILRGGSSVADLHAHRNKYLTTIVQNEGSST